MTMSEQLNLPGMTNQQLFLVEVLAGFFLVAAADKKHAQTFAERWHPGDPDWTIAIKPASQRDIDWIRRWGGAVPDLTMPASDQENPGYFRPSPEINRCGVCADLDAFTGKRCQAVIDGPILDKEYHRQFDRYNPNRKPGW